MDANILLSKIVAIPTDSTWSQVYSTINLYVALSLKSDESEEKSEKDESMVSAGKELLERIQREYFSQDEKNLENIKKSIEEATSDISDKTRVCIVLATVSGDNLYIVTVSSGQVVLKREGKIGVVAKGVSGEIAAFSGKIRGNDIIILETEDFAEKLPISKLSSHLDDLGVTEIAENLAPIVQSEAGGGEAAIILQYKKSDQGPDIASDIKEQEEEALSEAPKQPKQMLPKINIPKIALPANLFTFQKKKLTIVTIILLVFLLLGSIIFERGRQDTAKRQAVLAEILTPAEKKYEEANALLALNRGLALDELNQIKETLAGSTGKIADNSPERKKLDEFIGKVEGKIGELGAGATLANQKLIYEKGADLTQFKNGQLVIVTRAGKVSLLDSGGQVKKEFDTKNSDASAVAENDNNIFVLGSSGISQSTKTGSTKNAVKDGAGIISIDTFGSNLYALTKDGIDKYAGSEFSKSGYLKDATLKNPTSMTIDASIFVLDDGKIRKFTKGNEETFTVSGLTKEINSNAQIFTSPDSTDLYVLDPKTTRIIAISKSDGLVKNQYVSKDLANASSFAVDEGGKKIYVVISGKLYSFDL